VAIPAPIILIPVDGQLWTGGTLGESAAVVYEIELYEIERRPYQQSWGVDIISFLTIRKWPGTFRAER
jgi:hypothetical protein